MAFVWEITETGREKLADGEYLAALKFIDEKIDEYGSYFQIAEQLEGGKMRYEKFYVGHSDPEKKKKAIKSFNLFCFDLTGMPLGTKLDEKELINKKYILTIKNIVFENGNTWGKAVSRARVEAPKLDEEVASAIGAPTTQYGGIAIPQTNFAAPSAPLNDEVPF